MQQTPQQAVALSPYTPPVPARLGNDTQAAGAVHIASQAARIRDAVLDFLRGCGADGATIEEIAVNLRLKVSTVCGRVSGELKGDGLVEDSGRRRANSSGVSAKVWIAVAGRLL